MDYVEKLKSVVPRGIHPLLGAMRRRLRSLPARTLSQKQHLLADPSLDSKDRELLREVESKISPCDGMYTGNGAHYYRVGLSAIRCIEEAIEAASFPDVKRVLDLPCGHGRVLRFLVQRFPAAKFTVADLDRRGVDFCAHTFGAEAVYSEKDLSRFSLERQFDLIWCGSLLTHLNATGIHALLAFFARHLLPGGLLIFTTHGERVIQRMLDRDFEYGISPDSTPALISSYRENGFGFADYPGESDYGVSLTAPDWIGTQAQSLGLARIYFRACGWDDHQDVHGFVRPS
ncbi:MAG: class I SAM-dependent methyltransferase [Pyrinomonadaceae bacterium]